MTHERTSDSGSGDEGGLAPALNWLLALIAIVAIFCGAFAPPAHADTVNIDFEDLTHNTLFGGERYLDKGVRFTSDTGLFRAFGDFTNTDTPDIHIFEQLGRAIDMRFTTPVSDVSFSVVDGAAFPEAVWSAVVYDDAGTVLRQLFQTGGQNGKPFRVNFSNLSTPISRLVFTPSTDGEAIDSLSFTPTVTVPSPGPTSAAALFALLRFRRPVRTC